MDLLSKARIKIAFVYFILAAIILGVAAYLMYFNLTAIVHTILESIQQLLNAHISINQITAAKIIAQSIKEQVKQVDFILGVLVFLIVIFAAYLLAGMTLRPVRRAMERQKRFMSNISHELRTPLSVIRTNTEATLLGGEQLTRDELIEALSNNLEEVDLMAKIIEFLMNFSNIENRLNRLTFSNVDLSLIAKKAITLMKSFADEKEIQLEFKGMPSVLILGNATALEELILNLLKNAVAYTPPKGLIRVSVYQKRGNTTLSVQDSGVGIPEEDVPKIFEAFYRGSNVIGGRKNALGLGLSIVKEIATFHDATVSAKSAIGNGTSITVRFTGRLSRWLAQ
jgi:signal transduction histidine kinase